MMTIGIDVGSTATKAVLFNGAEHWGVEIPTGWNPKEAGEKAFREVLSREGMTAQRVGMVIGTGYGRVSLPFVDRKVTEIACHARGAVFLFPATKLVIDIGGQDSKVVAVNSDGSVSDFIMNDKCAAGTGRFLQVMAGVLDVSLDGLGALASSSSPVPVSSMCTVFAESEIIGLMARCIDKGAIAAGIVDSIARKVQGLVERLYVGGEVTFTGGIARNTDISRLVGKKLGIELNVPDAPQLVGALGAALVGFEARH
jgi:(R)-2-hydroxyacyl-CoA dehydratese activating ATPase